MAVMTRPQEQVSRHEVGLLQAFIVLRRQERFLTLLKYPKARPKLLAYFPHLQDLDPRFAHRLAPSQQTLDNIYRLLKKKGAPDTSHVMGNSELDGQDVDLWKALEAIFDLSFGNFQSCIPGKLGYFGGENIGERYILERQRL